MAKDTYYFSHDYNARTDTKIKLLIRKHRMVGYGIFWAIIEDLYNNANALPTDYEGIAFELHTDSETVRSIIHDFDLFVVDGGEFGSTSVQRRLNERAEKSKKASLSASHRWNRDANALRTQSDGNAIKERKGKEIKEIKESILWPSFEDFYDAYGKKVDRKDAEKEWAKVDQQDREAIMRVVPPYVLSTPNKKYRKSPARYLSKQAWKDEIINQSNGTTTPEQRAAIADLAIAGRL